jgi:O-antigen/teichoic acid export membrane protein
MSFLRLNSLWSLFGLVAPLLVGAITIPVLVHRLEGPRYGLLTLLWTIIGYLGMLDLGLGRSVTHFFAANERSGQESTGLDFIWGSLHLLVCVGTAGVLVVALAAPSMARLLAPPALRGEATTSFRLLGASIPFVTLSSGFRGILEAQGRFKDLAVIRTFFASLTFGLPALLALFTRDLIWIAGLLLLVRILNAVPIVYLGSQGLSWPGIRGISLSRPVLRFAAWTTLSNLVTPALVYGDRFVVSGVLSSVAAGYYATSSEAVFRLLLILAALTSVLFPAFSNRRNRTGDQGSLLLFRGMDATILTMVPLCFLMCIATHFVLVSWLGPSFAAKSSRAAQWLSVGVLVNSVAWVPSTYLQGTGRPDLGPKLGLAELILYGVVLVPLIRIYGVPGAAIAWSIRAAIDCIAHFVLVARYLPGYTNGLLRRLGTTAAAASLLVGIIAWN